MLIGLLLILALPVAAQRKVKFGIFDKATEQPIFGCEDDTTVYWTEGVQKNVFQDYKRDADGNKVLVNLNNPKQGYEMVARKANEGGRISYYLDELK